VIFKKIVRQATVYKLFEKIYLCENNWLTV